MKFVPLPLIIVIGCLFEIRTAKLCSDDSRYQTLELSLLSRLVLLEMQSYTTVLHLLLLLSDNLLQSSFSLPPRLRYFGCAHVTKLNVRISVLLLFPAIMRYVERPERMFGAKETKLCKLDTTHNKSPCISFTTLLLESTNKRAEPLLKD